MYSRAVFACVEMYDSGNFNRHSVQRVILTKVTEQIMAIYGFDNNRTVTIDFILRVISIKSPRK